MPATTPETKLPDALKRFPAAVQVVGRVEQVAERVEAARAKVRDEFHDRVLRAQTRLIVWQDKATTVIEKAQDKARAEKEKAVEETLAVTQRVESLLAKAPSAVLHQRGAALLMAWLKLPADVRDDVLTVAGVATARQTAQVLEEIAALRAELAAHGPTETKTVTPAQKTRRTRKEATPAEA